MVFNRGMEHLKHHVSTHGLTPLALALGVSVQRLSNWLDRGVPVDQCTAVEVATKGVVMRWHLRPDDWHLIWPELRKRKDAPAIAAKAEA
jgi:DNA-binding transcriptional regulator YdaS (Cro superfamily)